MAVEHIKYTDTLRQGADKINAAIDQSNDAIEKATTADANAIQALTTANNVQTQLDTIVIEGDSSVEAAQARVDAEGYVFTTLKERLDTKETLFSQDIETLQTNFAQYTAHPIFNVKGFGAVGDGVTDDTVAIQAAIDAAGNAGGGVVYFPKGVYLVNATLNLVDNVHLQGAGKGSVMLLAPGASSNLYNFNTVEDPRYAWLFGNALEGVTITDLSFDGNSVNQDELFTMLVIINSNLIKLDRLHFENGYGGSINLNNSTDFTVSNITFQNIDGAATNPGEGIYLRGAKRAVLSNLIGTNLNDHLVYIDGGENEPAEDIQVNNCIGYNCGIGNNLPRGDSAFSVFQNSRRIRLSNCHSIDSGVGFSFRGSSDGSLRPSDIFVENCSSYNSHSVSDAHGFVFTRVANNKINNCKAYNSGTDNVAAYGFVFVECENISISNIDSILSNDDGVRFIACHHVRTTGATLQDNSKRSSSPNFVGLRVGDATAGTECTDVYITNVRAFDTRATKLQNYGIYIRGTSSEIVIENCNLGGNANGGWIKDASVQNCVVIGSGQDGAKRKIIWGTSTPGSGYWCQGDVILNANPTASGKIGWVCVTSGTPGTWKAFGAIDA